MKKQLLSLLCAVALVPSFSANAQDDAIVEKWRTAQLTSMRDDWGGKTINWNDPTKVLPGVNPRFATAKDGKIYTINQQTMAIAEVTTGGLKDTYVLPKPNDLTTFYGTAISIDEAGNFLIGENFTERPNSVLKWAVFNPKDQSIKHFQLQQPAGSNIGRLDCVGRVLGDLTKEAYFFIAPEVGYDANVYVVKATGSGTVATISLAIVNEVAVEGNYTQQNIAQPKYNTLAEAKANNALEDFYYSSSNGDSRYYAEYTNSALTSNFAPDMYYTALASTNGFATFRTDGKQYFIRNYGVGRTIDIVIMDANGDAVATWNYPSYVAAKGGYSSIVAEPLADKTVNIYVYNCNGTDGAAAMLNFDPAKAGAPVKPEIPEGFKENPYKISTSADLVALGSKLVGSSFYAELTNDIEMQGVAYSPINSAACKVYLDGKNHVIRNLTVNLGSTSGNAGLFGQASAVVENLGLENVYVYTWWGCAGAFVGSAQEFTINNCFVTGSVNAAAVGGFAGTNTGKMTITNSYSSATVNDMNAHMAGGLIGRADAPVYISNVYTNGKVEGRGQSAGLIAIRNSKLINVENAVAWNPSVKGAVGKTEATILYSDDETLEAYEEEVYIYNDMLINGEIFGAGSTTEELRTLVTSWEAYNDKLNDGFPVLAWQNANGATEKTVYGTIDNPYVIKSSTDLLNMTNAVETKVFYAELANDIDMEGVPFRPLEINATIHFDGKQHTISNLVATGAYASIFTQFTGTIKNLGVVDAQCDNTPNTWGVGGILAAYANGEVTIDNCFTTGSTSGFYAGGIIGGVNKDANVTIKNSYAAVSVMAINEGYAGAVSAASNPNSTLTLENVYASGMVSGGYLTGGITVGLNPGHPVDSRATFNFNNVVAWNASVSNSMENTSYPVIGLAEMAQRNSNGIEGVIYNDITANNVLFWDEMTVNDEAVEGGVSTDELVKAVTSWEAYSKELVDDMPVLAWQVNQTGGIDDIEIEEVDSNAAPVYYNLQGVQVVNPENGIYIVRRGNKVSKVYVR